MMNLFGRAKESKPAPTSEEAISKMEKTLKMIEQRQAYLQHQIGQEEIKARKFAKEKNKREAMLCLKKKKICQSQITSLDNSILTLTNQKAMLENHNLTLQIFDSMRVGAQAMKAETKKIGDVSGVEDVIAEVEECIADAQEINDVIGQPIQGFNMVGDEDELEDEFNNLMEEQENFVDEELPNVPVQKLPSKLPKQQVKDEEDEFAALGKDMGW